MSNYIQLDSRMKEAWRLFMQKGILKREIIPDRIVYSWVRCRLKNCNPESTHIPLTLKQETESLQDKMRPWLYTIQKTLSAFFEQPPVFFVTFDRLVLYSADSFGDWIFEGIEFSEEYHGTQSLEYALESRGAEWVIGHEHFKTKLHPYVSYSCPIQETHLYVTLLIPLAEYEEVLPALEHLGSRLLALELLETAEPTVQRSRPISSDKPMGAAEQTDSLRMNPFHCLYQKVGEKFLPLEKTRPHDYYLLESSPTFIAGVEKALSQGAAGFLHPFEDKWLQVMLSRWEEQVYVGVYPLEPWVAFANQWTDNRALYHFSDIPGSSDSIHSTLFNASKAATHGAPVLLIGERGTGKSTLAQSIHTASSRASGPFIAIDCEALPLRGLDRVLFGSEEDNSLGALVLGKGGTVYIDHVECLPNLLQKKILKSLDVDTNDIQNTVRFIFSASNDLKQHVAHGVIREDLYQRIGVFAIVLPPLRERKGDIKALTKWLIHEWCRLSGQTEPRIDDSFFEALASHHWPGNARELQRLLQDLLHQNRNLTVLKGTQVQQLLTKRQVLRLQGSRNLEQMEKEMIQGALEDAQANVSRAAELLGIGRTTLYRKLEKYQIEL